MSLTDSVVYTKNLLVGGITGAISKTAVASTEGVKLIMQVQHLGAYVPDLQSCKGALNYVIQIPRDERILAYCPENLTNVIPYLPAVFNLAFNNKYNNVLLSSVNPQMWKNVVANFSNSSAAGVTSLCFTYPYNFAKMSLIKYGAVLGTTSVNMSVLLMINVKFNVNVKISKTTESETLESSL